MNRVEQLGDEAKALIKATRDAYEPSASNRAQVCWAVERTLSAQLPSRVTVRGRRPVLGLAAAAILFGGVGVAATLAWRGWAPGAELVEQQDPTQSRHRDSLQTTASVTHATVPAPSGLPMHEQKRTESFDQDTHTTPVNVPRPTAPVASALGRPASLAPPSGDLSAEATLIARAQAATNRGQGARALELLHEYDSRFGKGALAEERAAARIFALCSAGNVDQARAEAVRFRHKWPRSPQIARVRQACASGSHP